MEQKLDRDGLLRRLALDTKKFPLKAGFFANI